MNSFLKRALLLMLLSTAALAQSALPPLPPLTNPPTNQHLPGKFVWADLFTSKFEASRQFYEQLFGWQFRWISEPPQPYGIFSVDGIDVAGLAYRESEDGQPYARWVHYVSVSDVDKAESIINANGGRTLLRGSVADRGDFAIFGSPDQALLGVIQSSSGDPEDFQAWFGEWIWHQLYVHDLEAAVRTLETMTSYEIRPADEGEEVDRLLVSDGFIRAGLEELPAGSDAAPTWLGFIRVNDLATAVTTAKTLGGDVHHQSEDNRMAIVADPNGGLIGLLEWDYPEETEQ